MFILRINKFTLLCLVCITPLVTPNVTKNPQSRQTSSTLLRYKREACQDGTYQSPKGKTCCRCAVGQHLVKHCTLKASDRTCEYCVHGRTYSSVPSFLESCEPCRSCDPKANLEEDHECTIRQNTRCRCQQDHYCDTVGQDCKVCHPCQICGEEGRGGIKTLCTATNNTVCHDPTGDGGGAGTLVAVIILPMVLVILVGLAIFFWLKKEKRLCFAPKSTDGQAGGDGDVEQRIPLRDADLMPHRPAIAKMLGWTVMKEVAIRSAMSDPAIENHHLNFPNSAEEQCLSLLTAWVEKEGSGAAEKLVQTLLAMHKKDSAEKVTKILNDKPS